MCGLTGLWDVRCRIGADGIDTAINRMTRALACRGPDDAGVHREADDGVALGHRRLSILDLSPEGHQPMVSPGGRYVIVYNGEIYNFRELRRDLEARGFGFRGHSDTEVLLAAIGAWGLTVALERANGMFALALWDREHHKLFLARDRLGIKPLFYGWIGGTFVFASELKALQAMPGFTARISRAGLTLYLRRSHVPEPYSIYETVFKLTPGAILSVDTAFAGQPLALADHGKYQRVFWSARNVFECGAAQRYAGTPAEAVTELERLLKNAVAGRMVSDVPLGAFLSGGIDSSTVVALMQAQSRHAVRTFSIGFDESGYDEARHARAVATHLGTQHRELYVTPRQAMDVIPSLADIYDEPFADFSQIPMVLLARLARREVTVALSGDGGDELFCGYNRYFWSERIWRAVDFAHPRVRRGLSQLFRAAPGLWSRLVSAGLSVMPPRFQVEHVRDKVELMADVMGMASPDDLYDRLTSHWINPGGVVLNAREPPSRTAITSDRCALTDPIERMMYLDLTSYLPDDILTKVDRATMSVGLEARVPILDHRVVEFAAILPREWKMRHPQGKWPLRQLLYRYVPKHLVERPKQGFNVPVEQWLRGPLRDWAEALLDRSRLESEGYFDATMIGRLWRDFLCGRQPAAKSRLWTVLMFQAWRAHHQ